MARQLWRGAALAGIGLAGGAALVTARHLLRTPQPLDSGLPGEMRVDRLHGGDVYYTVAGPVSARPIVLLHGFYPGASNYEFHAIFSRLAESHRVYAPDWLGFGMSERPALTHTGEFYAATLTGFLRDVVAGPATVVAHGLAANIATRAASDAPELFDRLMLVAPEASIGMSLDPTPGQAVMRLFQKVALGITPYAFLTLRPSLRLAAGLRSAVGPMQVDDATLDHLYASAHQFGGEYAMLSLLTGELDLPMRQVFPLLRTPTLIVIGARDARHPLDEMERLVALNPRADLEVVSNAGETVYLDQPSLFTHALHRWLGRRVARHEPAPVAAPVASAVSAASIASAAPTPVVSVPPAPAAEPAVESEAMIEAAPAPEAVAEPGPATEAVSEAAPAAKVVSVLEPLAPDSLNEVRVTQAPEGETLADGGEPAQLSQPLTLEPADQPRQNASGPHGGSPVARADGSEQRRPHGSHAAQSAPLSQGSGYRYAPEMGAHILRPDRNRNVGRTRRSR